MIHYAESRSSIRFLIRTQKTTQSASQVWISIAENQKQEVDEPTLPTQNTFSVNCGKWVDPYYMTTVTGKVTTCYENLVREGSHVPVIYGESHLKRWHSWSMVKLYDCYTSPWSNLQNNCSAFLFESASRWTHAKVAGGLDTSTNIALITYKLPLGERLETSLHKAGETNDR